ncbi:large subunit ribosomal protein L9 [Ruaniaceae bacterium KH17]|nr:large subunit ribosomal protein L9 [Ruaniaceae bacterium KH17]
MKLILTQEVDALGAAGDIVEVKDGYARNYLIPRGFATPWTKGAGRQIEQMKAARKAREIASIDDARALRDELQGGDAIVLRVRAGESGRLFGAVTATDVAAALAERKVNVDKRRVQIAQPIKAVGDYDVVVRLHDEVDAKVAVKVRPGK